MKKILLSGLLPGISLLMPMWVSAFEPVSPGDLNAEINGMVVDLTWEWGNAGAPVLTSDFEWSDFNQEHWEVKNTYDYDIQGNWQILTIEEAGVQVSHSGNCAALMMGTESEDDPSENHQDEWLIVRPGAGAVYMDFWYFLHPELREVGSYRDFPDHYYVQISYDNGESWEELWDGRWDMGAYEGVQQASLFLGEETDDDTLVAFHAVSGEEETLYFLWAIDDVEFYSEAEYAERKMRVSPSEWLNNGNITYRVYLDGEVIADYLKARHFTDYTSKAPGEHTYEVVAWSEALDEEYEAAVITVGIEEFTFASPQNVVASYEQQSDGKYIIEVRWEEPDSELQPAYYNVTVNGKSIAWIEADDDLAAGQTGIYKGAYTFGVEAVYQFPEGVSVPVYDSVYPGTVPTVRNLHLEEGADGVLLSWDAPATDALQLVTYSVFRGDELLAEGLDRLSYTDPNPLNGRYSYNVHAVYGSEVSLPLSVDYGDTVAVSLPYTQTFDNGHLPLGWSVMLVDPNERVKDMYSWRFDNWFGITFPEDSGIEGGCASVTGVASGFNLLRTFLVSPEFALPSDGEPYVSFTKYYYEEKPGISGSAQMILGISVDGEEDWRDLEDLKETANGEVTVSLANYKGRNIRLRWGFNGRGSGEVAIDNVSLTDKSTGVETIIAEDGIFDVYTVNGLLVVTGASKDAVNSLPKGVYIIRSLDGKSLKHMVR